MARREDEAGVVAERSRDRRSAGARLLVDMPVTVVSEGFQHACRTVNISLSGMVVELNASLGSREPHLVYSYELALESSRRIRVAGRTAWRRGRLQGVRFIGLTEGDLRDLSNFIHEVRRQRASDLDRLALAEHLDRLWAVARARRAA